MNLTLYVFKICPVVEKINILINEKNIVCEKIYVNIRDKPEWFLKLSPSGQVPILKANDIIIFESTVISEFLNEIFPYPSLHPNDPVQKAYNRSWIEYCSQLFVNCYHMILATNKDEFDQKCTIVKTKLAILETQLGIEDFFNDNNFSMIDITYAPLFRRFDSIYRQFSINMLESYPKLQRWSGNLLKRPSVQDGFIHNFDEEFMLLLKLKNSCLVC